MDNFEKPYRGRILPEADGSVEKHKKTNEEILQEADKLLQRRERGRFVEGKLVPFEKRLEELEEMETAKGKLSFAQQAELDELRFKLRGPKMDRWAKGIK